MLQVQCPDCSKTYDVADDLAGKTAKCRECGAPISIPQLRANADNAANRTKPDSATSASASSLKAAIATPAKPAPTKPLSPKPTTAPLAKSKPTAKQKPAPKKRSVDDFFEDDGNDGDDYDELEEVDELDEVEDYGATRKRPKSRRKKHSANSAQQVGRVGAFVAAGAGKLAWTIWLWVMRATGAFGLLFLVFATIGTFLRPNLGSFGVIFLMFGMLLMGMKGVCGVGIPWSRDSKVEGFAAEVIGSLLVLISNPVGWGVILLLIGYIRLENGMLSIGPRQNVEVVQPEAVQNPIQPGLVTPVASGVTATDSFQIANIPIPEFQNLPPLRPIGPQIQFASSRAIPIGQVAGTQMHFSYYEPIGAHSPQSLPCVIVASAGTNLLVGNAAPTPEYDKETRPYVDAGFAVLGISLDGEISDLQTSSDAEFSRGYQQFRAAAAGLVNVRNGIEFLTRKVPQVDPQKIFIAGHSSAGTLALLAATNEPRLRGCAAYCPCSDVERLLRPMFSQRNVDRTLPDLRNFAKQSSPLVQVSRTICPVFLFHAADDSNTPVAESRRFRQLLQSNNKQVNYFEVLTGDHYDSMIQQGIPRAIPWMRQLATTSAATVPATAQATAPNRTNPGVPKGAELPAFPFGNLPPPSNIPRQPVGRVVTFRFQSFAGNGDSIAAARQALRETAWADLNDLEIDSAKGEIRIGQLGGSLSTEPAREALANAGFQMLPGVSIGNKSAIPVAATAPNTKSQPNTETETSSPTTANAPSKSPLPKTTTTKPAPKDKPPATSPPAKARENQTPRRIVKFRYERFSGKGSSDKALRDALKRFEWANPEDIVLDVKDHEIRIGLLMESSDFEPARKALSNAGFVLAPGVTTATVKD